MSRACLFGSYWPKKWLGFSFHSSSIYEVRECQISGMLRAFLSCIHLTSNIFKKVFLPKESKISLGAGFKRHLRRKHQGSLGKVVNFFFAWIPWSEADCPHIIETLILKKMKLNCFVEISNYVNNPANSMVRMVKSVFNWTSQVRHNCRCSMTRPGALLLANLRVVNWIERLSPFRPWRIIVLV